MQSRVIGSGRTDTGVHASGQVVAVAVNWRHSVEDLQNAWNAHLPDSITVRQLVSATTDFHPRFSAEKRTYRYTVYDSGNRQQPFGQARIPKVSPLVERFALYVPLSLNVVAMQEAAACLVGEHDFATFGQPPQGENTVRIVHEATWQIVETTLSALNDYPGRKLVFTVTANAFLRQMVRNFVGTLLMVGKQQWQPDMVTALIQARNRGRCAPPAPPQGLVLEHVTYPTVVDPWIKLAK
jgi:tRNA pseudouridine38-40 synthase